MKVLIIGGNRFVGAEIVTRAVLEGHNVTVLALDQPSLRNRGHVQWVKADRTKHDELATALHELNFDIVIDNIAFTPSNIHVLLKVLKGRIGRYILTSTVDIYKGLTSHQINIEDKAPLDPSDPETTPKGERYLRGKRGCEKALMESDIPWSVIRPAIVFGRTDPIPPGPRNIHILNHKYGRSLFMPPRILDGGPILLRHDDRRVFRLTGPQDVATALLIAARHPDATGQAFNVTGNELWTSERLIRATCDVAGIAPNIVRVSVEDLELAGLGDYHSPYGRISQWSVADNRKLKSLGWSPTPVNILLTKLVEAAPTLEKRPFYYRRLQEIALGQRIQRQQRVVQTVWRKVSAPPVNDRIHKKPPPRLQGKFSAQAVKQWQKTLAGFKTTKRQPLDIHFRTLFASPVSTVGIGTHRGDTRAATDELYRASLHHAIRGGINVIDTAINYRRMKAERIVGQVIAELNSQEISRDALCICSKGGFIPQDADDPRPADRYIRDEYIDPKLISMTEAIKRHCINADYIRKSLEQSLANLNLEHIDIYFLHNPERAMVSMNPDKFLEKLQETFVMLEEAVQEGKIGMYGIATWEGLRVTADNAAYLPLERIIETARKAGGKDHNFRAIQLPLNVARQEAYLKQNQKVGTTMTTVLEAASSHGLYVLTSASVLRGQAMSSQLSKRINSVCKGLDTIQTALNFARSVPGVGTSLVGMRKIPHVEKALAVTKHPLISPDKLKYIRGQV